MDKMTRMGLAFAVLLASIVAVVLGFRETLPVQNMLSSHELKPTKFGLVGTQHQAQRDATLHGYGFLVDAAALPERYDASTHPWVSEPAAQPPMGSRILLFHPAVKLESSDVATINGLMGGTMRMFFYQGKIVALAVGERSVVDWSRTDAGISQRRHRYWMYAAGLFLVALVGFIWRKP